MNKTVRTCDQAGCENKYFSNGFCRKHFSAWRRANQKQLHLQGLARTCELDGCDNLYFSNGMCQKHHTTWYNQKRYAGGRVINTSYGTYKEVIGYAGAHERVRTTKGLASNHVCFEEGCEAQAKDWALQPNPKAGVVEEGVEKPRTYSTDPSDYEPMCRSHHKLLDLKIAKALKEGQK